MELADLDRLRLAAGAPFLKATLSKGWSNITVPIPPGPDAQAHHEAAASTALGLGFVRKGDSPDGDGSVWESQVDESAGPRRVRLHVRIARETHL